MGKTGGGLVENMRRRRANPSLSGLDLVEPDHKSVLATSPPASDRPRHLADVSPPMASSPPMYVPTTDPLAVPRYPYRLHLFVLFTLVANHYLDTFITGTPALLLLACVAVGSLWLWEITMRAERPPVRCMTAAQTINILCDENCPDLTQTITAPRRPHYFLPLSTSASGDIYQAHLSLNETKVAIKAPRFAPSPTDEARDTLKRLAHELSAWHELQHVNILRLHGLCLFQGRVGMVLPWNANGSIMEYTNSQPSANRYLLCSQVASGVNYIHTRGVVHGDLKGANVWIDNDGIAKITDFGNPILQSDSLNFAGVTDISELSARWAAPEILTGSPCSAEADVYALGMTILEVLTGKVPYFEVKRDTAVVHSVLVLYELPRRPDECEAFKDDELWGMLSTCWARAPSLRIPAASAREIMTARSEHPTPSYAVQMTGPIPRE